MSAARTAVFVLGGVLIGAACPWSLWRTVLLVGGVSLVGIATDSETVL